MYAIELKNVVKRYGNITAVDGISLTISNGTTFGLIGPNGAGKTTLIKSLLDLLRISSGSIKINSLNHTDYHSRSRIGFLPENFNFYPYYSIENTLKFFAALNLTPNTAISDLIKTAALKAGITDLLPRKIKTLSKGQRQRVGIASLFMGEADILLLDEPFSGLDPIGIKELKDILRDFHNSGKTVIVSSHILAEIETLCDEIAIINKGRILASGKTSELRKNKSLEDFFYDTVTNAGKYQGGSHA